jgi:hypothetical protein
MAGQGREPIADLIDAAFEHLRHLGVPPGPGPAA